VSYLVFKDQRPSPSLFLTAVLGECLLIISNHSIPVNAFHRLSLGNFDILLKAFESLKYRLI